MSAYTYKAKNFCQECVIDVLGGGDISIGWEYDADAVIRFAGIVKGIDVLGSKPYSSNDFPKIIDDQEGSTKDECSKCAGIIFF